MSIFDYVGAAYEAYLEDLWEEKCRREDEEMERALEARYQDLLVVLDVLADPSAASPETQAWALEWLGMLTPHPTWSGRALPLDPERSRVWSRIPKSRSSSASVMFTQDFSTSASALSCGRAKSNSRNSKGSPL